MARQEEWEKQLWPMVYLVRARQDYSSDHPLDLTFSKGAIIEVAGIGMYGCTPHKERPGPAACAPDLECYHEAGNSARAPSYSLCASDISLIPGIPARNFRELRMVEWQAPR